MRQIIYDPDGVNITFGEGSLLYGVTSLEGLGVPGETLQEQKSPFQDGTTNLDQLLKPREIVMSGIIMAKLTTAYTHRRALCAALNPKNGPKKIQYTNDYGSWIIYGTPIGPIFANNNSKDGCQKYQITFHCHDPYWQDVTETVVSFVTGDTKQINIVGDVPSPITLEMSGIGFNPSMTEAIQDKTLTVQKTIAGDIKITTGFGEKKAVLKNANDWALSFISVDINAVCYSDENRPWIAVGDNGVILYSIDGNVWNSAISGTTENLDAIAWSSTLLMWVIVGAEVILYSTNGTTWAEIDIPGIGLNSIVWSPEKSLWIAVGFNGVIYSSATGITWTAETSGVSTHLNGVAWSPSLAQFVAVGDSAVLLHSSNGTSWTAVAGLTYGLSGIAWSPDLTQWVAVGINGYVIYSSNGTAWSLSTSVTATNLKSIAWSHSLLQWVAVGGVVIYSSNGTAWSVASISFSELYCIAWSPSLSQWMAVGYKGTIVNSINGTAWVKPVKDVDTSLYSCAWSPILNLWVAVGGTVPNTGIVVTSVDGVTWGTAIPIAKCLFSVAWNETLLQWVAVGETGSIFLSTDAITWNAQTSGTTETFRAIIWNPILRSWFAVGDSGVIRSSTNGTTWNTVTSGITTILISIALSPSLSQMVAVGQSGVILYSTNGTSWTKITIAGGNDLRCVAWSPFLSLWVILGSTGIALSSINGTTWENHTGVSTSIFQSVAWSTTLKMFIAVANDGSIQSSDDGKIWVAGDVGTSTALSCIEWNPTLLNWLIVGQELSFLSVGDTETNIIQYLSSDSSFYSLQPGINSLSFYSGGGLFTGNLTYRNRFIGV